MSTVHAERRTAEHSAESGSSASVSWLPAILLVILVTAGELEYRQREVTAAVAGKIDAAVVVEILATLAVGAVLFLGAVAPRGRRVPAPLGALWALVIVLTLSSLWAPSAPMSIVRAGQLVVAAGFATTLARRASRLDFAALAHGYVIAVTAYIALGLVWSVPPNDQVAERFNWARSHPVSTASLLLLSVIILLGWTRRDAGPRMLSPTWVWILLTVHTAALFATQTRGALAAAVVGLAVWTFIAFDRRRDIAIITVLLAPLLYFMASGTVENIILRGEGTEKLQSLNSRSDLWAEAFDAIGDSPWIGKGYFSAREIFLETIGLGGAHNAYIEVVVSAGIIGAVVLVITLIRGIATLVKVRQHPQRAMVGALLAALLVNGLTIQFWAQGGTAQSIWMALVFGWIAMMRREEHDARPSSRLRQ